MSKKHEKDEGGGSDEASGAPRVVIVGGGFAGVGCALELAKHHVQVTLVDQYNVHQFQPLIYQAATAELAIIDIARPFRGIFHSHPTVTVRHAEVATVDVEDRSATTTRGEVIPGDFLVLGCGSRPNFFGVPGAEEHSFPLYNAQHANHLRSRLYEAFEDAFEEPARIDQGALNVVVIGGGPTGVETAGAIADVVRDVMPDRYRGLDTSRARIILVDHGGDVLHAFSPKARTYASEHLVKLGVELRLHTGVTEITEDRVKLDDGSEILTRTAIWAGGIKPPALIEASGLPTGAGGRVDSEPDLTLAGHPRVYVLGDMANQTDREGEHLPQLGSVALQAGRFAARNILRELDGKPREPFKYHDKGIMAMVGSGAAVAEVGGKHHELQGPVAFAAWLGVHAWLMSGIRQRVDAFVSWAWDFLGNNRDDAIIDPEVAHIDWGDDDGPVTIVHAADAPADVPADDATTDA